MITGELSDAVAAAAGAAQAAGELAGRALPDAAALAGRWRPVPTAAGGGPGSYASSIPFLLASRSAGDPAHIAAVLAARLTDAGAAAGICRAAVTGPGYLSLTVSPETLGRLAARITQAGPGCARSAALRGTTVTAPARTVLAAAGSWDEAWRWLTAELGPAGQRGGRRRQLDGSRRIPWWRLSPARSRAAVAFAGPDAIRYALIRAVPSGSGPGRHIRAIDPRAAAAQHLGNPFYAVRYAHAHAASILRQSADLGLPAADAAQFQPRLLAHPREQALLDAMSWLPERVAGAARRGQPHVLAAYLEELAGKYLDWQECCSLSQPGAFPPGPDGHPGRTATRPDEPSRPDQRGGTALGQARLVLAAAARTVLGTGLGLLGVAAPGNGTQPD